MAYLPRAPRSDRRPGRRWSDPLKVSIVVALNVVDELFKQRIANGAAAEDARQAGEITTRLIAQIDRALDPEPAPEEEHLSPPR